MGMFDNLRTEYPLPSHPEMQGRLFQTKDTPAQAMFDYRITADGRLIERGWHLVPAPERELIQVKGELDEPEELSDFHGDIHFYDFADGNYENLVTFRARFTEGQLSSLIEVSHEL